MTPDEFQILPVKEHEKIIASDPSDLSRVSQFIHQLMHVCLHQIRSLIASDTLIHQRKALQVKIAIAEFLCSSLRGQSADQFHHIGQIVDHQLHIHTGTDIDQIQQADPAGECIECLLKYVDLFQILCVPRLCILPLIDRDQNNTVPAAFFSGSVGIVRVGDPLLEIDIRLATMLRLILYRMKRFHLHFCDPQRPADRCDDLRHRVLIPY